MNNENLEFLQDSLKYLGFGEKVTLNTQLEEAIAGEPKDFQLDTECFFDEDHKLELTLYFRRSDQVDMYFFNKYEARLRSGVNEDLDRAQTFYINKGRGVTLKEAFNLLQGRAVNKDLVDSDGQKYNAWIQLNFLEKDQYDNYKVRQFRPQYGFDLEKTLEKYPIRELKNEEMRAGLIRSLKKGNLHPVSFQKILKTEKMFIEANPQFKTINIFPAAIRHGRKEAAPKANDSQEDPLTDEGTEVEVPKEEELETTETRMPGRTTKRKAYK